MEEMIGKNAYLAPEKMRPMQDRQKQDVCIVRNAGLPFRYLKNIRRNFDETDDEKIACAAVCNGYFTWVDRLPHIGKAGRNRTCHAATKHPAH
jgi:hypothetical protein